MDKLKNLLKSDTPTDDQNLPTGATGKITGQGSHFPHHNEPTSTAPTTVTGTEPETRGPADVSAVKPDPVQASSTAGPESTGSEHVSTLPIHSATTTTQPQSTGLKEAESYNVTNADFPKTTGSADGSGTAAIGSTTTDPLTYKKPETGAGAAGVGAGAASAAATTAFSSSQERSPGHENPYKASEIDPRVDGGSKSSTTATETGLATAAATTATKDLSEDRSAQAPASLTTTADPVDRSTAYSKVTSTQGLDEAKPISTSTSDPAASEEKTGMVGKVLGAVGLGGIAGTAAAKLSSDKKESAIDDTAQPTTTTGVSSYKSPTESGPGTSHHRKESIPTTAYPAGVDSPGAINAPIGGTRAATTDSTTKSDPTTTSHTGDSSTGHTAAIAGTGAGAAVIGGAAVGHEHHGESKGLGDNTTSTTATTGQTAAAIDESKKPEDHTTRDAAIGAGAGAAAIGAGAVGAHEYSKKEAEKAEAEAAKQQAARQKEIEEQHKATQKQAEEQRKHAEKQQKEAEKQAEKEQKAAEKEEKAHQKAIEKEEKKHQKELEKEEKQHQKEIAAAEKKHEKEEKERQNELEKRAEAEEAQRRKAAEEEEERRKAAAAAAVGVGAGAGTATAVEHEKGKDIDTEDKEKKPSLFKRIFKKRKNSKTGEEEEYESDEDHTAAIAGGSALGAGAAGTAVLASHENDRDQIPRTTETTSSHPANTDPLASTQPSTTTAATSHEPVDPLASTQPPSQTGAAGFVSTGADGKPQYTVIPQPPPESTTTEPAASKTGDLHGSERGVIGEDTTAAATTGEHAHTSLQDRIEAMTHENFGVIDDHKR